MDIDAINKAKESWKARDRRPWVKEGNQHIERDKYEKDQTTTKMGRGMGNKLQSKKINKPITYNQLMSTTGPKAIKDNDLWKAWMYSNEHTKAETIEYLKEINCTGSEQANHVAA